MIASKCFIQVSDMYYGINFSSTPQCCMFGRYQQKKSWDHSGRILDNNLLIFVISGNASFQLLTTVYDAVPGDWILIPKGIHYSANTSDFCEYYFFHFDSVCEICEQKPTEDLIIQHNYQTRPTKKTQKLYI